MSKEVSLSGNAKHFMTPQPTPQSDSELQARIEVIRKRYAKKVDSLNWQGESYQKQANDKFNEAVLQLINSEADRRAEKLVVEARNELLDSLYDKRFNIRDGDKPTPEYEMVVLAKEIAALRPNTKQPNEEES